MPTTGKRAASGKKPEEDAAEMPRQVLEKIVLRRGSLRGLGQQFGRSNMWLWRQVRHNKRMDLAKASQVLEQLEVPPRFFFEEILDQTEPYDPVWLLEHFREGNGLPRDPFFSEFQENCLRWLETGPRSGATERRRSEIDALEEQRYFNRARAKAKLEQIGRELMAAAASVPPSRKQLADCAHMLLIWASIQRARGHRDDSTDGYLLAYRLAVAARDSKLLGIFFYYAAHLLSELGQPGHGLRFAERACAIFQRLRERELLAQSVVQIGIAHFDLGQVDQARAQAIAALRLAPRESWRTRVGAWLLLGNLANLRGHYRSALGKFDRSRKQIRGSNYVLAFLHWREAAVLSRMRRLTEAAQAFRSAIALFESYGQPLDVAFVTLDLAEMLMSAGRFRETLAVAKAVTPSFEKLSSNAQASALWLDLMALLIQGSREGSMDHVAALRSVLQADPGIRLRQSA